MPIGGNRFDKKYLKILYVVATIALFLFSIDLMTTSLNHLGKDVIKTIFNFSSNQFVGLFVGLLSTAIIQSSSTTTSMIVAAVAAGSLDITGAIPMIMGANIGTTLTNNIVSLGYLNNRTMYSRALTMATSHDFFNIILVAILFPLQYYYDILGNVSAQLAHYLSFGKHLNGTHFINSIFYDIHLSEKLIDLLHYSAISLVLSIILLFISIKYLARLVLDILVGRIRSRMNAILFKNTLSSFLSGLTFTAAVQSSSVSTSLIIPMVSTARVKMKNAFSFIIGANIGTTITALLAAIFKSEAALAIALAHFLFNLAGVIIFLPFKITNEIPLYLATQLGRAAAKNRLIGFIYILVTFFLIPFALILITK